MWAPVHSGRDGDIVPHCPCPSIPTGCGRTVFSSTSGRNQPLAVPGATESHPAGAVRSQPALEPPAPRQRAAPGAAPCTGRICWGKRGHASSNPSTSQPLLKAEVAPGACRGWSWGSIGAMSLLGHCVLPMALQPQNPSSQALQSRNSFSPLCSAGLGVPPAPLGQSQPRPRAVPVTWGAAAAQGFAEPSLPAPPAMATFQCWVN